MLAPNIRNQLLDFHEVDVIRIAAAGRTGRPTRLLPDRSLYWSLDYYLGISTSCGILRARSSQPDRYFPFHTGGFVPVILQRVRGRAA